MKDRSLYNFYRNYDKKRVNLIVLYMIKNFLEVSAIRAVFLLPSVTPIREVRGAAKKAFYQHTHHVRFQVEIRRVRSTGVTFETSQRINVSHARHDRTARY